MAEGFDIGRFKSFLDCSICLQLLDKPKTLKCSHVFCKGCIEDIMEFSGDGYAVITCPMQCADETRIARNEIVNDLTASYNIKSMLEALKMDEARSNSHIPLCYEENCKNEISVHCCEMFMCEFCHVKHQESKSDDEHKRKMNLYFNNRENKLNILCEKHVSKCTHLCMDNTFLCMYCLHRDAQHAQHVKNTIEKEVALIKEVLVNDSNELEKNFARFRQFRNVTKENITSSKEKFDELLQQRKEKCLRSYNDFLNKEEEMLKRKFESICKKHLEQYPLNITLKYYEEMLQKTEVELAILKEEIQGSLSKSKNNLSLNFETVSVSDSPHFRSDHPLGDIVLTVGEEVSIHSSQPIIATLRYGTNLEGKTSEEIEEIEESEKEMSNILSKLVDDYNRKIYVLTEENCKFKSQIDANEGKLEHLSKENLKLSGQLNRHIQAYFDIEIFFEPAGRIIFDLYYDVAPKTCENFIQLCTHRKDFGYKGNKFHCVGPKLGYCVGGDITEGDGSGGKSIYGENFPCENFIKKHDDRGTLSMYVQCSNREYYVNSVFFINTKAIPVDDGHHVVFGKVTKETYSVVEEIMKVEINSLDKPIDDVEIVNCGILLE